MSDDQSRIGRMSLAAVDRTRRVVEAVEASPIGLAATVGGGGVVQFLARAKVTTAIPTGTWDTPSDSGRAQFVRWNGTAWTNVGDPVKVYNDNSMPDSIPVGRVIKLGWIAGQWWLLTASCS